MDHRPTLLCILTVLVCAWWQLKFETINTFTVCSQRLEHSSLYCSRAAALKSSDISRPYWKK